MAIGASSNKSSNKSTTNQTQTMTPTNPAWVEPIAQGLGQTISGLAGRDPTSFFADPNGLLTQAGQGGASLATHPGYSEIGMERLANTARGPSTYDAATVKPNTLLSNLDRYMSPYLQDVVDTSLADYDVGAGRYQAQDALTLAGGDDTFGGSGGMLMKAMTTGELARGRGALSSGLRDQGFRVGADLSDRDAARRQQAQLANAAAINQARQFNAGQSTGAAQSLLDNQRANVGLQADIGSVLQSLQQGKAGAPLSVTAQLAAALSGLPLELFRGQTSNLTGTTKGKSSGFSLAGEFKLPGE